MKERLIKMRVRVGELARVAGQRAEAARADGAAGYAEAYAELELEHLREVEALDAAIDALDTPR